MGNIYIGDANGHSQNVVNVYIGDANSVARKVVKVYVGDENDKAQLVYSGRDMEIVGTGTNSATFDISPFSGATADNFIIAPDNRRISSSFTTQGSRSYGINYSISKTISGNILSVSISAYAVYNGSPVSGSELAIPFTVYYLEKPTERLVATYTSNHGIKTIDTSGYQEQTIDKFVVEYPESATAAPSALGGGGSSFMYFKEGLDYINNVLKLAGGYLHLADSGSMFKELYLPCKIYYIGKMED